MARLPKNDQREFKRKLFIALDAYRVRRREPMTINSNEFIKEFDLTRTGKHITYKALSDFLKRFYNEYHGVWYKNGIWSQQTWRNKIIIKMYQYLSRHFDDRRQITKTIQNRLKLSEPIVNSALRQANLGKEKLADKLVKKILNDYKGNMSASILLKKYKITEQLFRTLAVENGLVVRDDWHEKGAQIKYIDFTAHNPQTAHLIGLIWADGSISGSGGMNISLDYNDYDYLDSLRREITLDDTRLPSLVISEHSKDNGRFSSNSTVTLSIARKSFISYLKKIGFVTNKETIPMGLPSLIANYDDRLFWSFLRAFMEGDGAISSSTQSPVISFSVSDKLGIELQEELWRRFQIKSNMAKDRSIYRLAVSGTAPVLYMLISMYSVHQDVIMQRKYQTAAEKYEEFAPKSIKELMPTFNLSNLRKLNTEEITQILSSNFSFEKKEIHLYNKKKKLEFKGERWEFFEKYPNVKRSLVNSVLTLFKKSANGWELHPKFIESEKFCEYRKVQIFRSILKVDRIHIVNRNTGKSFEGSLKDFLIYNDDILYFENLLEVIRGSKRSINGWELHPNYKSKKEYLDAQIERIGKLPSANIKIHMINKNNGKQFIGTKSDFLIKNGIFYQDLLDKVLRGDKKSIYGWIPMRVM